jgi:hypothetical protein
VALRWKNPSDRNLTLGHWNDWPVDWDITVTDDLAVGEYPLYFVREEEHEGSERVTGTKYVTGVSSLKRVCNDISLFIFIFNWIKIKVP